MQGSSLQSQPVSGIPYPIWVARLAFTAAAGLSLLTFILAPLNIGTFDYNNAAVTGPEFLRRAWLVVLVVGAGGAVFAYGLWQRQVWVRPAFLALLIGSTMWSDVYILIRDKPGAWTALVFSLLFAGGCAWYLYGNTAGRHFFDALRERATAPTPIHPPPRPPFSVIPPHSGTGKIDRVWSVWAQLGLPIGVLIAVGGGNFFRWATVPHVACVTLGAAVLTGAGILRLTNFRDVSQRITNASGYLSRLSPERAHERSRRVGWWCLVIAAFLLGTLFIPPAP